MKLTIATIATSLVLATSAFAGSNNTGRDYAEGIAANTFTTLNQVSTKLNVSDALYNAELAGIVGAGKTYGIAKSAQPSKAYR